MNEVISLLLPKSHNERLVRALVDEGVAFLIVGGVAVAAHRCRDACEVDDLDLLIEPTAENGRRLLSALSNAQIPSIVEPDAFARSALQIPLKTVYYAELLTPKDGYNFSDMLRRSLTVVCKGLPLKVVSIDDLVRMKEEAVAHTKEVHRKHVIDLERLKDKQRANRVG